MYGTNTSKSDHKVVVCGWPQVVVSWSLWLRFQVAKLTTKTDSFLDHPWKIILS